MPSPWTDADDPPASPLEDLATDWARRVEAVTATLDRVERDNAADEGTHDPECWMVHTACLAARLRGQLNGEAVDGA